ncbi:MAG: hypothetical protein NVS2B12_04030 [Ktedonobacteraceae bacterium]
MKLLKLLNSFLHSLRMLPLSWLPIPEGHQFSIVALTYGLGTIGLWLLFPRTHNGASMFLPIIIASWLFRYRGMLVSLVLNGIIFQLFYLFLWGGILSDAAFIEGGGIGFGSSLGLGLIVCWLRTAVDEVQRARQHALSAERERVQAKQAEQLATLAYEQQRKINEIKDQFLLNVSHELRTPLTVLGGSLELLRERREHLNPVQQASLLQQALASQEELVDLVNNALDAATLISDIPQVKSEIVSVPQIVQDVLSQLAPGSIEKYTILLHMPEQVMALADPQFLRQVLRNLLSNVFKYVPPQTEVCIEVTQVDPSSAVCLSVQDAGPGIPAEELPLLFEKFVRITRDLAGPTRGTGLGLYICKQLVQAMGGRIWVESSGRMGEGCRFCLTLSPFVQ